MGQQLAYRLAHRATVSHIARMLALAFEGMDVETWCSSPPWCYLWLAFWTPDLEVGGASQVSAVVLLP